MKIEVKSNTTLTVRADNFSTENFNKLNSFPGFAKWENGSRNKLVRINGVNLQYLMDQWPDAQWSESAAKERDKLVDTMIMAQEIVQKKEQSEGVFTDESGYVYKRPPMDHQQRAFVMSRDRESFGLFMEQGTGKTKVTLDTACYLYNKGEIDMLVVMAWPNGVHRNWVEFELESDVSVPYEACFWAGNHKSKKRQAEFEKVLTTKDKLKIFTFNAEAFTSAAAKAMLIRCLKENRCMLVIDQSACIKNPNALRTKFMLKVAPMAKYRRILDGAPVAEGATELFSQFKFLNQNIIGHDTFTAFKAEFCEMGYFNQVSGYKNLPELHRRIDGHCYRVLSDDCLELPPRTYMMWPFDMKVAEKRIFDEMKTKSLAYFSTDKCGDCNGTGVDGLYECESCEGSGRPLEIDSIEQSLAMVKNMRLQQISSGWWPEEGNFKPICDKTLPSRLSALKSLIEQAPGKMLIFARFRADLEAIQDMLGDSAVSYHGGIKEDDRTEAKRRFQNDPKTLFFIGQPRNAGIGHTLTAAKHVVFYSNDSSLRFREESEKRAHRTGQKNNLIVWDLIANASNDIKTVRALRSKKNLANEIMQDPETYFLNHE